MRRPVAAIVMLTVALAAPALAEVNAQALFNQKCKLCHELNGVAGPAAKVGGKLDGVGSKYDAAWLRAYLADPQSKRPDSKMKKVSLSSEELDALAQFLSQQK